jgi:hypothetical protein
VTELEGNSPPLEEHRQEDAEKHPLLIWAGIRPGDVVSLRVPGPRDYVGTVESMTTDGHIIWIRDNLNERRLFHFRDIEFVGLVHHSPGRQPEFAAEIIAAGHVSLGDIAFDLS